MFKLILLVLLTAGCAATGTNGVVSTGNNQYMIGGIGKFTDFSGSVVKARFIKDAESFCQEKGMGFEMTNSSAKDVENGNYASAEVQFKCVPKG